jgi:hypothetical protein
LGFRVVWTKSLEEISFDINKKYSKDMWSCLGTLPTDVQELFGIFECDILDSDTV